MDSPQSRPRAQSHTFSLHSDKSSDRQPVPLSPNEKSEKARRDSFLRGESKANPNAAINEVQPGLLAVLEKTTLDSIRNVQHKDANGNVITEPDLSNPTRPRWERPLDTIRSFEAAIDGGYKRKSMARPESTVESNGPYASRRSSSYMGYDNGPSPSRYSQVGGAPYGGRHPDSYYDGQAPAAPYHRPRHSARASSDSYYGRPMGGSGGYPPHGQHQSHDTINTGLTNGSDSTGPWNNSTDPSSENSSPDRANGRGRRTPQPMTEYYDGVGGETIMEEYGSEQAGSQSQGKGKANGYGAPAPPAHNAAPRRPIPLGSSGESNAFAAQTGSLPSTSRPQQEDKRKSWLKRRFSKKD